MELKDFLNSINSTKESLFETDNELADKKYQPFIINRCLSYFPDTLLYVNDMNMRAALPHKMQNDYLIHSIAPRKRFSKWLKPNIEEALDVIKKYYGFGNREAMEAMSLLSEQEIEELRKRMDVGGKI